MANHRGVNARWNPYSGLREKCPNLVCARGHFAGQKPTRVSSRVRAAGAPGVDLSVCLRGRRNGARRDDITLNPAHRQVLEWDTGTISSSRYFSGRAITGDLSSQGPDPR